MTQTALLLRVLKHLLFVIIAVGGGYGVTLFCYVVGGNFVRPSLFLARLVAEDRGGESLLPAFAIINTAIAAIGIYIILWVSTRRRGAPRTS